MQFLLGLIALSAIPGVRAFSQPTHEDWKASKAQEANEAATASARQSKMGAVDKVVSMLKDLQASVLAEGEKEAKSYNKFACFCQDTQSGKTADVQKGADKKSDLSASVQSLGAERDALDESIATLVGRIEAAEKEMKVAEGKRSKELKLYRANEADLAGAIRALRDAMAALKASNGAAASMVQLKTTRETLFRSESLRKALATADALGLAGASRASAFLEQDPDVPMEDYKFHSGSIIETLEGLQKTFKDEKASVDAAEVTAVQTHQAYMQQMTDSLKTMNGELTSSKSSKAQKQEDIATTSEQLSTVAATLLDDQSYLKDLYSMCQQKAVTWDARSKVRQDELSALTAAIDIVAGSVSDKVSDKTLRFALKGTSARAAQLVARNPRAMEALELEAEDVEGGSDALSPSLLQQASASGRAFLARVKVRPGDGGERAAILNLFRSRSQELHSAALTMLAGQISADPLAKVKTLIQELIERLLKQASNEESHKGWCDKSISDAEQKRGYAADEVKELNGLMAKLEARQDMLAEELTTLAGQIATLNTEKDEAVQMRADEKAESATTIEEANAGHDAVGQAIDLLTKFYATAAKASVGTSMAQQGPATDAPDAGFEGGEAYTGAQGAAGGVIGMLEVISGDFERTISETEKAEKKAEADHTQYLIDTGKSIAEKTTAETEKKTQKSETDENLSTAEASLKSQSEVLSTSIKELLELKPACIDTGMSYEERVEKREQEVEALKKGLCIFEQYEKYGPDGVGGDC